MAKILIRKISVSYKRRFFKNNTFLHGKLKLSVYRNRCSKTKTQKKNEIQHLWLTYKAHALLDGCSHTKFSKCTWKFVQCVFNPFFFLSLFGATEREIKRERERKSGCRRRHRYRLAFCESFHVVYDHSHPQAIQLDFDLWSCVVCRGLYDLCTRIALREYFLRLVVTKPFASHTRSN